MLVLRRSRNSDDTEALLVVDVATGAITRPTWQRVSEAAWAPRGDRIAYVARNRFGDPDVYVTSADGRIRTRLTRNGYNEEVTWSPDARWIAYVDSGGNPEIMVVSPDGKHARRLTDNLVEDRVPVWVNPSTLAFERWYGKGNRIDLMTVDVKRGRVRRLAARVGPGSWSPDRRRIALEIIQGELGNTLSPRFIYLMDADGSHLRQITTDRFSDTPRWSPDGRSLLYVEGIDGSDLWVTDADGRHRRRLAFVYDGQAAWQP